MLIGESQKSSEHVTFELVNAWKVFLFCELIWYLDKNVFQCLNVPKPYESNNRRNKVWIQNQKRKYKIYLVSLNRKMWPYLICVVNWISTNIYPLILQEWSDHFKIKEGKKVSKFCNLTLYWTKYTNSKEF